MSSKRYTEEFKIEAVKQVTRNSDLYPLTTIKNSYILAARDWLDIVQFSAPQPKWNIYSAINILESNTYLN